MKTIDFEIRTSELSASNKKLVGYAVRWNSLSEVIWDEFREQFAPGAFKDSLASGSDVRALYEHNYTQLLGRTKSGTLVLSEDDTGLRFELTPPYPAWQRCAGAGGARGYLRHELWFPGAERGVGYRPVPIPAHCYRCRTAGDYRYLYACLS